MSISRGDLRAFSKSRYFWGACIVAAILATPHLTVLLFSDQSDFGGALFACNFLPSAGLIVFGVLHGILRVIDYRRARRAETGFCVECGYNLTGNVSGGCPECGTEITEGTPETRE